MTEEGIFLGGGSNPSQYINAELPNIKGKMDSPNSFTPGAFNSPEIIVSGCFSKDNSINSTCPSFSGFYGTAKTPLLFKASTFNPIYKDNGNVQPNHYVVEYWIKYK